MLLNRPGAGGAGQAMPDGRGPVPGGWNRAQIEVEDLVATVEKLKSEGYQFRNEIVMGNGGKQVLLEDPSGNPVELFEPDWVGPFDAATLKRGLDAIEKGDAIGPKTQRECDWLAALKEFYKDYDKVDQDTRTRNHERAMERLASKYPDDVEAKIFQPSP